MCHPEVPLGTVPPPVRTEEVDIRLQTVERMPGLLAMPDRTPAPAVLIANDVMGRSPFYEHLARRLAQAGYIALDPEFFFREGPVADREAAQARRLRLDQPRTLRDLEGAAGAARDRLAAPGTRARILGRSGHDGRDGQREGARRPAHGGADHARVPHLSRTRPRIPPRLSRRRKFAGPRAGVRGVGPDARLLEGDDPELTSPAPRLQCMRLLTALPLALLLLLAAPSEAFACSCNAFTPVQLARESEVIFTGVPRSYVMDVGSPEGGATIVEFDVERVFKGRVSSRVRIEAVGGGAGPGQPPPACGRGVVAGRRYTVFARDYDGDGTPNTNGCLRNVEGVI